MTKHSFLFATLALAGISSLDAAITQYTDRAAFLAALSGHVSTDFSSLTPGDQTTTSLSLFGGNPAATLLVETRNQTNTFTGDNLWLSDAGNLDAALGASTTYSDQLRISGSGFTAIGADWFLGDFDDNYLAGTILLTFSDSSTFSITSASQADSFRGFISDVPLTSVLVAPADPDNVAGWVTIDNVATIPEPTAALLGGVAGLSTLLLRRRNG